MNCTSSAFAEASPFLNLALVACCLLALVSVSGGWKSSTSPPSTTSDGDDDKERQGDETRSCRRGTVSQCPEMDTQVYTQQNDDDDDGNNNKDGEVSQLLLRTKLPGTINKKHGSNGTLPTRASSNTSESEESSRNSLEVLGTPPLAEQAGSDQGITSCTGKNPNMSNRIIGQSELPPSTLTDSFVGLDDTSVTGVSESEQDDGNEPATCLVSFHPAEDEVQESSQQDDATTTRQAQSAPSISFSTVCIYSHAIILGDSPCVSSGAPLAIGSEVLDTKTISVEAYENAKPPTRTQAQLKMPAGLRQRMLRAAGVSHVDILRRTETCDTLRYQLQESARKAASSYTPKRTVPTLATGRRKGLFRQKISSLTLGRLFNKKKDD